ncbi:MAG: hypothetical protein O3A10_15675 [Chloroflexi bacterium]|nr:hypothetical protein [Chloroflexota bacterium]MDA1148123.1 hypothetical protein [Chloroflexota bacterium]
MRIFLGLSAAVAATLFAACSSGSDGTATSTSTAVATSTVAPVGTATAAPADGSATPIVDTARSFAALVDLAGERPLTLVEGPGTWNAWFEASGEVVNALILGEGQAPRTARIGLDGTVIADSTTELQVRVNADGRARAFGGLIEAGTFFETMLEVDGVRVPLAGDIPTVLPVDFSPGGDLLLSYVGVAAAEGEAAIQYMVHDLDGALVTTFTNRLSTQSTSGSPATWSPSGTFVATSGLDGVIAHDVRSGGAYQVPLSGSTEWSPTADKLLLVDGANTLRIVQFPGLEMTSITVPTANITASFDPSGRVVAVSDANRGVTTIFDAASGVQLQELFGVAEGFVILGFEPVVMTDAGLAALLTGAPTCGGTRVIHPALGDAGACLEGSSARWSPNAGSVSYTRGSEVLVYDVESRAERVVASGLPTDEGGTLARWNASGTHLLLEWPWGGGGWTDSLP